MRYPSFPKRVVEGKAQDGGGEPVGVGKDPAIVLIDEILTGMERLVVKERTDALCSSIKTSKKS